VATSPSVTPAMPTLRPFVGGEWLDTDDEDEVTDKYTGHLATRFGVVGREQLSEAVRRVSAAQSRVRLTIAERAQILAKASALVAERRDALVAAVVTDTGFTITDAIREVSRGEQTLMLCSEEVKRLAGEVVPLEGAPGIQGRIAFTTFHPRGTVCAITPFNSPVNTVLHKLGPAIAAGNGVVLKPAEQTPRSADALLSILLDAGLPPDLIAVLYGPGHTVGQWLLEDQRIDFYAFTGSTEVGAHIQRTVGLRPTQLELGSISSTVICADADIERCVQLVVNAGFRKAGQVCTSVQRLYVERGAADNVSELLRDKLAAMKVGDPWLPETFVGPLITPAAAERVDAWITEAVDRGAAVIAGAERDRNVIKPTVLIDVDPAMKVMSTEIFGPVIGVRPFDDLDVAIDEINDTPYGLAAGVFTANLNRALRAAERLRMGGVHINETSSSRVDLMPYGGVKASGHGIEGPRYAIREMSEQRLITIGGTDG
jgi:acyl-CoA reductase-like NAD-dependent aldehyde dehydrogenase